MNKFANMKFFGRQILIFTIIFCLIGAGCIFCPKKARAISAITGIVEIAVDPYTPAAAASIVGAVEAGATATVGAVEAGATATVGAVEGETAATTGQTVNDEATWLEEVWNDYIKPIGVTILRKAILDRIVDQIIGWISGEGDPAFITDWQGFMKDASEQAGGFFLQELLGKDLMDNLCRGDWAVKINLSLQKPKKFSTRAMCTFDDIVNNFDQFMDNFSNGGWANWIKVTESQNNPYGLYLMALDEKTTKEIEKAAGVEKDVAAGGGFLSDKVCVRRTCYWVTEDGVYDDEGAGEETGEWKKSEAEPDGCIFDSDEQCCKCEQWETRTPGQTIAAGLNKSLFKDQDWLVNNEMWQSYVVAILDAMVNRLVKEGVTSLKGLAGSPDEKDYVSPGLADEWASLVDTTPPTTTAKPFSEYSVEIIATSEEPAGSMVKIYYTTNGSSPTTNPSDGNTKLYTGPITILGATVLKWFGVDFDGNKEGEHNQTFVPPFIILDITKPSTIAVAVEPNKIALIAVPFEPATIYYTLDGTEPTTASKRYIEALDASAVSSLKWFSQDKAGNTEDIQTLSIDASLFDDIKDLIVPTANITAPSPAPAGAYFQLDPSASSDSDSTNRITRYEWDFDNDETYDWWTIDWNRDGVLDESQCRSGVDCNTGAGFLTGSGFKGMQVPVGVLPGVVEVKYEAGIGRMIGLRVTDDEGLSATTNAVIDVE